MDSRRSDHQARGSPQRQRRRARPAARRRPARHGGQAPCPPATRAL